MRTDIDTTALVGAMGDAVMVCDKAGMVMLWNPACERLFGWTEAEALGQSMDMIIPERLRKRHWDGYHQTMATGSTKYGHDVLRVPAVNKQGAALSIAFTVALLLDQDDKVSAIASIVRDETDRFAEERTLKKRVMELETRLAATTPQTPQ